MWNGRPASPGVAIGTATIWLHDQDFVPPRKIADHEVEGEVKRFSEALVHVKSEIKSMQAAVRRGQKVSDDDLAIFDTQIAYLEDRVFRDDVESAIRQKKMNLEGAISTSIRNFARIFELVENDHLKERASDLRDVGLRVLRRLRGGALTTGPNAGHSRVLVTDELLLSDVAQLELGHYSGVVAEGSAERSHPVILARSLGIPIVTGIPGIIDQIKPGDMVILDGSAGSVYVNPEEEVRTEYLQMRDEFRTSQESHPEILGLENKTKSGEKIELLANIAKLSDLDLVSSWNLDGVGLFRTEFDYVVSPSLPTVDKLTEIYGTAAEKMGGRPLNVRLLEIDSSRPFHGLEFEKEINPALGQRSLRLLLRHPELLRPQLKALFRAAKHGNVGVLVPFIASLEDVAQIKDEIRRIESEEGKQSTLRLGVVIEIPSAIYQIKDLLADVDFCAVGTDNLTQYLTAADRNNSAIATDQEKSTPAVVRVLARIAEDLRASGKDFYPYGDIVADSRFTPFLVGSGYHCLSMTPVAVPRVKKVVTGLDRGDCEELVKRCLECKTRAEIDDLLTNGLTPARSRHAT